MRIFVIHESPERLGKKELFEGKSPIRIGRHPDNDCVFDRESESGVSAFHAEIHGAADRISIRDLGSLNGLFVNGDKVTAAPLAPRDRVELGKGGPVFRVELESIPERKYGEKTLGLIVERAILSSTARQRRALAILGAVVAIGFLGIGYALFASRPEEMVEEAPEGTDETAGESIAGDNRSAVFLLAGRLETPHAGLGALRGFCSAFAVAPDLLATNGHCAEAVKKRYREPVALMNSSAGSRYAVVGASVHPGYRPGRLCPDVGLVRIAGKLPHTVRIASAAELRELGPGSPVFLYGFPDPLSRIDAPVATFVEGEIGRVTAFDQTLRGFEENTLLQHSAFSSAGTSGSPIFDASGGVIGINSGSYVDDGEPLSGYNFAMRIDLIAPLLEAEGAR